MIHGDRLGCLLGEWIAGRMAGGEDLPGVSPGSRVLARSIVSSRLLDAIAARHGLKAETTLTGFKWLSRVPGLAFAYEEALGYCVAPEVVRDKDGISTALLVAEYASLLASRDSCLSDALDDLDRSYGVHLTRLVSLRLPSEADLARVVAGILSLPPNTLGGSPVISVEDGLDGFDGLPPTPGVRLTMASGARVIVRPSGTELRVKAYLEVVRLPSSDLARDRAMAGEAMAALKADTRVLLNA
jgi:phosphomannomutase